LKGRCVADRKGPDDLGCLKYIEIYIYNYIYMIFMVVVFLTHTHLDEPWN
jgi:hypothetical protein